MIHSGRIVLCDAFFCMPGLDDQDENADFETQLLEELLEHFETGAGSSFDQSVPFEPA